MISELRKFNLRDNFGLDPAPTVPFRALAQTECTNSPQLICMGKERRGKHSGKERKGKERKGEESLKFINNSGHVAMVHGWTSH